MCVCIDEWFREPIRMFYERSFKIFSFTMCCHPICTYIDISTNVLDLTILVPYVTTSKFQITPVCGAQLQIACNEVRGHIPKLYNTKCNRNHAIPI